MANKAKAKKDDYVVPADIMGKAEAHAEALGVDVDRVIEVALRDFFYNVESGKRPRSMSALEDVA